MFTVMVSLFLQVGAARPEVVLNQARQLLKVVFQDSSEDWPRGRFRSDDYLAGGTLKAGDERVLREFVRARAMDHLGLPNWAAELGLLSMKQKYGLRRAFLRIDDIGDSDDDAVARICYDELFKFERDLVHRHAHRVRDGLAAVRLYPRIKPVSIVGESRAFRNYELLEEVRETTVIEAPPSGLRFDEAERLKADDYFVEAIALVRNERLAIELDQMFRTGQLNYDPSARLARLSAKSPNWKVNETRSLVALLRDGLRLQRPSDHRYFRERVETLWLAMAKRLGVDRCLLTLDPIDTYVEVPSELGDVAHAAYKLVRLEPKPAIDYAVKKFVKPRREAAIKRLDSGFKRALRSMKNKVSR